jgi:hypothetical protein
MRFPHAPATAGHDAPVRAAGEHAAAGNGVAVDCGHQRFRMKEHRLVHPMQHREKPADVVGAACAHLQQVPVFTSIMGALSCWRVAKEYALTSVRQGPSVHVIDIKQTRK